LPYLQTELKDYHLKGCSRDVCKINGKEGDELNFALGGANSSKEPLVSLET